jgi:hypothetical protein
MKIENQIEELNKLDEMDELNYWVDIQKKTKKQINKKFEYIKVLDKFLSKNLVEIDENSVKNTEMSVFEYDTIDNYKFNVNFEKKNKRNHNNLKQLLKKLPKTKSNILNREIIFEKKKQKNLAYSGTLMQTYLDSIVNKVM